MEKVKEVMLADLKKSNKARKLKLAQRYGFTTVEEYLDYLLNNVVVETEVNLSPKKKPTIHNVFMLDASSSMKGSKYESGVEGIKKLIQSIANDTLSNNTLTVIEFTTEHLVSYIHTWLSKGFTQPINFIGAMGRTPLYQAIGKTIAQLNNEITKGDKVLLNIVTDGEDTEGYDIYKNLAITLKQVQEENNYTVTFIGTEADVARCKVVLNIDDSNTLSYDNTGEGLKKAFDATVIARENYSMNTSRGLDVSKGFYKTIIK